jgi:hypothetical protein
MEDSNRVRDLRRPVSRSVFAKHRPRPNFVACAQTASKTSESGPAAAEHMLNLSRSEAHMLNASRSRL